MDLESSRKGPVMIILEGPIMVIFSSSDKRQRSVPDCFSETKLRKRPGRVAQASRKGRRAHLSPLGQMGVPESSDLGSKDSGSGKGSGRAPLTGCPARVAFLVF